MSNIDLKCQICGDFKAYDKSHCVDCLKGIEHRQRLKTQFLLNDEYSQAAAYRRLLRSLGRVAMEELLEQRAIVIPKKIGDDWIEGATSKHVGRRADGSFLHASYLEHRIDDIRLDKEAQSEMEEVRNSAPEIQIAISEKFNFVIPALKMAWKRFVQTQGIDPYAHMKVAISTYLEFAGKQIQVAGFTDD